MLVQESLELNQQPTFRIGLPIQLHSALLFLPMTQVSVVRSLLSQLHHKLIKPGISLGQLRFVEPIIRCTMVSVAIASTPPDSLRQTAQTAIR